MTGRPARARWLLLLPLSAAALAYRPALRGAFVFDDLRVVVRDPSLDDLGALLRGAWGAFWGGARPVAALTFALNRAAGGLDPLGYHLVNLALHLAVVALVFLLTRAVLERAGAGAGGSDGAALAVAGLFALHPLQSEPVAYVTQRSEVLASLFMVAALLAFLAAGRRGRGAAGAAWYAAGLAATALALGSKPMAVTLPALWALLALVAPPAPARRDGPGWRDRALLAAPVAGLVAAHAAATLRSLRSTESAGFDLPGLDAWSYFLTQWRALVTYLRLAAWPAGQSVDWDFPVSRSLAEPAVLGAGILLAGLLAGAAALLLAGGRGGPAAAGSSDRRAMRLAGAGLLWFFVALAPTSSFVPLADPISEHRVYLALWGPLLAVVVAGERLLVRWRAPARSGAVLVAAAWLACGAALAARAEVWSSPLSLWTDATAGGRGGWRSHLGLGLARAQAGDPEGALSAYQAAFERARGRPAVEAQALHNAGLVLLRAGRPSEAAVMLRQAAARTPGEAEPAFALASALQRAGRAAEAAEEAARGLRLEPGHPGLLQLLGILRVEGGQVAEGLGLLEAAVRRAPGELALRASLGTALEAAGRLPEACRAWREAAADPRLGQSLAGVLASRCGGP